VEKDNQADSQQFLTIRNELAGILDKWKKDYSTSAPPAPAQQTSKGKKKKK
jgi:hypothetical protein